ncbi:hypothetical protein CJ030_MR8G020187 [Morella rubra]|uniref:RNase H type-1 domain-containing protein n=1 Tax=Morella rubra TaxID=262757 RepID=A0A6A1UTL7_9ROSI|nr:hypothetical protein CJ030_MR8G020187 [Morella rubra]
MASAILRDCNGSFKGASAMKMALLSPLEAEAAAAQFGILEAQRRGFNNVIIGGDSVVAASAINFFPTLEGSNGGFMS